MPVSPLSSQHLVKALQLLVEPTDMLELDLEPDHQQRLEVPKATEEYNT